MPSWPSIWGGRAARPRSRSEPSYSTWLDNTKAKFLLGWRPDYDLERLIEEAWTYQRAANDPRKIWYPG